VCQTSKLRYASVKKLIDGAGAKRWGGRWNPPGIPAVYCSLDEETALAELQQRHRRGGVPMNKSLPRLFVALRARLKRVLNLTSPRVLATLGVSADQLCEEWQDSDEEPLTQAIARLAVERRLDGVLVPSVPARPHGVNLVVFPVHASVRCLKIYNRRELPPGD
jgi:RES domain-containing protein